ncbi:D-alanine transaminase [Natronospira proteinivora]|uniref:D-alanine transaminase n=1 Tax=Natronospira proteinivora TaxID=1807133 RepID=A0ABT1GAP6_9GAMM|nr:D-amino acid aminotransferase [Natronospira proteinivora]MCP1727383.1 D-alanine transaminase [Natronospira proteinivora]
MAQPFPIAWFNGRFQPLEEIRLSPLDRGFLFADGVYEVIPVYQGHPFQLEAHLDRLDYSLDGIRLPNPMSRQDWREMVETLIQGNGGGDMTIYFQVTRGADHQRDHGFPGDDVEATRFAMASPLPVLPERIRREGARACLVADTRWARCDIKSIALLPNVLAKQQAREQGADEALFHRDGELVEGSSTTLFLVVDGVILTPPKSHAILPGITRDVIIELAKEAGLSVRQEAIPLSRLSQASEAWISSSSREMVPLTRVGEQPIGQGDPGPVWKRLQDALVKTSRQNRSEPA